jgi:hypothetical protein
VHEGEIMSRSSRPPSRLADRGEGGYALTPAVSRIMDSLPPLDRIAIVLEIGRALRVGRLEALALTEEQAEAERKLRRDVAIRAYAHETYPALSGREKAAGVAKDMLRSKTVRRALGGAPLGASRIRQILGGQ